MHRGLFWIAANSSILKIRFSIKFLQLQFGKMLWTDLDVFWFSGFQIEQTKKAHASAWESIDRQRRHQYSSSQNQALFSSSGFLKEANGLALVSLRNNNAAQKLSKYVLTRVYISVTERAFYGGEWQLQYQRAKLIRGEGLGQKQKQGAARVVEIRIRGKRNRNRQVGRFQE